MKQYQGEPGQVVNYGGIDGATHKLEADEAGVLTAKTPADEAMLEQFGLVEVKKEAKKTASTPAKED